VGLEGTKKPPRDKITNKSMMGIYGIYRASGKEGDRRILLLHINRSLPIYLRGGEDNFERGVTTVLTP